mgnify:CR=1 FL=1
MLSPTTSIHFGTKKQTNSASSTTPKASTSSLEQTLSRSANPSTDTLTLTQELTENPELFTKNRLTKGGEGNSLTNTARKVLDLFTGGFSMKHAEDAREHGKTSKIFRAMNKLGGNNVNIRVLKELRYIAGKEGK